MTSRVVPFVRAGLGLLVAFGVASRGQARAEFDNLAVFGAQGVAIGQSSTVVGGRVASNATLTVNNFSTFTELGSVGTLTATGATVSGNVTTNADASLAGSTVGGSINSGGNVDLGFAFTRTRDITAAGDVRMGQSQTINGNVVAGGSFSNQAFSAVNGNVAANRDVTINGTVNGDVRFGNALTIGTFGQVTGARAQGTVPVNPAAFTPVALPAPTPFVSGGASLTSGGSLANPLAPGRYGSLSLGLFTDLFLRPGDYYFDSIDLAGSQSIHLLGLDSQSLIRVFVTGNINQGVFVDTIVNGREFEQADASLAANVFWETRGQFTQARLGVSEIFGTVFAPDGDITIGQFSSLAGALVSGRRVDINVGFNATFVPTAIPEPASIVLLLAGGALAFMPARLAAARRRRDPRRSRGSDRRPE